MTEKYPIEKSYGGDNTAFVSCPVYNASRHYAVCLRIITRKEENNPHTWEPDCNAAIACRECPALKMRDEEEAAGHALYYTPRDTSHLGKTQIFDKSYQRGWGAVDKVKRNQPETDKPVAKSKPKRTKKESGSMHADLVNKLMDEEKKSGKQPGSTGTDSDS